MSRCVLCERDISNTSISLCKYHYYAYLNIKKKYPIWKERMEISFSQYLSLLEQNPYTGKWVKDVIKYMKRLRENVDGETD